MQHIEKKQVAKYTVKPMTSVMASGWRLFALIHCHKPGSVGLRGREV